MNGEGRNGDSDGEIELSLQLVFVLVAFELIIVIRASLTFQSWMVALRDRLGWFVVDRFATFYLLFTGTTKIRICPFNSGLNKQGVAGPRKRDSKCVLSIATLDKSLLGSLCRTKLVIKR